MSNQIAITGPRCFGTSQKKSWFDEGDKSNPGPGAHDPQRHDKIENPQWSQTISTIRDSFLDPHRRQYPSPQHYKLSNALDKKSPKFSFPHSNYQPKPTENNILYYPDQTIIKPQCPQFSFGYSFENNYSNGIPGPGSYESETNETSPSKRMHNSLGISDRPLPFGQAAKFPGPGKYLALDSERGVKYSFGRSERVQNKASYPSAGFYDIAPRKKSLASKTKIYDFKGARRQTKIFQINENPAPNHYATLLPRKIAGGVVETSERSNIEIDAIVQTPSPNKYKVEEALRSRNKGCSFIKDVRHLSVTERTAPGPGAYEPMKTLSNLGGAIGKNGEKQKSFQTPSCVQYQPKLKLTQPKVQSSIMLKADRVDFSRTVTGMLGPGAYNLVKDSIGELSRMTRSHLRSKKQKNH